MYFMAAQTRNSTLNNQNQNSKYLLKRMQRDTVMALTMIVLKTL